MLKKLNLNNIIKVIEKLIPFGRVGDKIFAYLFFFRCHKRFPKNEMLFNDVLFRFKVSDQVLNPGRTFTTDKEFVKLYIKSKVGDKYNVPTLAILHTEDEINKYDFPSDCVIKATHSCNRMIARKNGSEIDYSKGRERMIARKNGSEIDYSKCREWLSHNYYFDFREANYRYLSPKIIVEPLLFDGISVCDYRFFCFKGHAKCIFFSGDRFGENRISMFFDTSWNMIPIDKRPGNKSKIWKSHTLPERPENLPEMIEIAEMLSEPFDFIRVDLISGEDTLYVGELTHCHTSATQYFSSKEDEILLSEIIFGDSKYDSKI